MSEIIAGVEVTGAHSADIPLLTEIWFNGWQDGHKLVAPARLRELRTMDSFRARLERMLDRLIVVRASGRAVGFAYCDGSELNQFYIDDTVRGKGIATVLMTAAERALSEAGFLNVFLDCAAGNARAAAFYRKAGWTQGETLVLPFGTGEEQIDVEIWRFTKELVGCGPN